MNIYRCILSVVLITTCSSLPISAQQAKAKDYASYPYWLNMMNDTNANYFEAEKAFSTYWKGREKPRDESEKFESAGKVTEKEPNVPYSFEYKKFKNWEIITKPFVRHNGTIMYPVQRLQFVQDSRKTTNK